MQRRAVLLWRGHYLFQIEGGAVDPRFARWRALGNERQYPENQFARQLIARPVPLPAWRQRLTLRAGLEQQEADAQRLRAELYAQHVIGRPAEYLH